ncbi:hypothetical protein ABZT02_18010 [Streptomyces sp. NPDC005402]
MTHRVAETFNSDTLPPYGPDTRPGRPVTPRLPLPTAPEKS